MHKIVCHILVHPLVRVRYSLDTVCESSVWGTIDCAVWNLHE